MWGMQEQYSFKPLAPAVVAKLVPPQPMQMLTERLCFNRLSIYPAKYYGDLPDQSPSPQSVNQPLYTSPPKMRLSPRLLDNSRFRYLSMLLLSLSAMLAPSQQLFLHTSSASSQQKLLWIPSCCHMRSRLLVCLGLSWTQPSSFSIWTMMMLPPLAYRKGFATFARAVMQSCTQASQSALGLRIYIPFIPSNLAGRPPKSHSAQTQGPGLSKTFIWCFLANPRNPGRSRYPFSKSKTPLSSQWKFHMTQTLRELSPILFSMSMRCYQYSLGMRAK